MPVDQARSCLPMHPRGRCTWICVIGPPILKEPKLADVRKVIKANPKIPIAKFIKIPKVPKIPRVAKPRVPIKKPKVPVGPSRGHIKPFETSREKIDLFIKDAKKRGITLSRKQAFEITNSVNNYTGYNYDKIRVLNRGGKAELKKYLIKKHTTDLPEIMREIVKDAKNIEEYLKVAPKFKPKVKLFRGIMHGGDDIAKLSKGSIMDMQGTSSFSTKESIARKFASKDGVIFELKEAPDLSSSIKHLARFAQEEEVLISSKVRYNIVDTTTRVMNNVKRTIIKLEVI